MPEPMFNDLLERHLTRPFKLYVDTLRNKVSDLADRLNSPAALDQYPGRRVPYAFSRLYGPVGPTTPRRGDAGGFEELAPLAQPAQFILPRNGNIRVGQIGSFFWQETNVYAYLSWTYSADPGPLGNGLVTPVATFPSAGDIFDNVFPDNGGALAFNNFRFLDYSPPPVGFATVLPPDVSFDLGLYEKTRGRFLHDRDRMPINVFAGQNFANRKVGQAIRFDPNTELEPRVYINEVRMGNVLDTDQAYNAAQVKVYLIITFHGYLEQK
jgi:hypothetical protein